MLKNKGVAVGRGLNIFGPNFDIIWSLTIKRSSENLINMLSKVLSAVIRADSQPVTICCCASQKMLIKGTRRFYR